MNHTVHGLRARRCPSKVGCVRQVSQRVINGVRALDEGAMAWMAKAMECHGRAIAYIWDGTRCEVGGQQTGVEAFCDCWLQLGCCVRLLRRGVVRSGTLRAERISRPRGHRVGRRARA